MRVLLFAALAVVVTACGPAVSTNGDKVTIKGADGSTITAGQGAPANLPAFAPVYPGGQITSGAVLGQGGMLAFKTSDSPEKVLAFYAAAAKAAGLAVQMESTQGGADHVVAYQAPAPSKHNFTLTTTQREGFTEAVILYGRSPNPLIARGLLLAAAVLALAACKPKPVEDGSITIRRPDGAPVATLSEVVPADVPPYARLMPGAAVVSVVNMGTRGAIITFTTSEKPEAVLEFYKQRAEAAGLHRTISAAADGRSLAAYEGDATHGGVLSFTVEPEGALSKVSLTYGPPG